MELIESLEKLNFTKLEAQIYTALLGSEPLSAYQLAKKINISRPSIYNALEHMLDKGMVETVPDQTALYTAQDPAVLLGKMRFEMTESLERAQQGLEEFQRMKHPEIHFVFRGFDTAVFRAKELLRETQREVYINADFPLSCFREEFERLSEKGVRIVIFSFYEMEMEGKNVEFYTHGRPMGTGHAPSRLMLAADGQISLTADGGPVRAWSGTVSNNPLTVKILSEHIHHDIYLLKLQQRYGKEIYGEDLWLHTDFEKRQKEEAEK